MANRFLFFAFIGLGLLLTCKAAIYLVGDTAGWDISTDLNSWVAGKNFEVGDVLLFQYSSLHSVCEVPRDDYENCDATNAIQTSRDGNTSIPLSKPGQKFFICGTTTHCLGGMKLQVNVNGGNEISPATTPLAPESEDNVPTSFPHPPPTNPSAGFLHGARDSLHVASFSMLGTLLWMLIV